MRKYAIAAIPVLLVIACAIQLACGNGTGTTPPMTFDPLHAPRNFEWSVGNETIFVSWDYVPFAEGYRVYLSSNGADFNLYSGSSLIPGKSIVITEVQNSIPYYVGVSAVGTSGVESAIGYLGGAPAAQPLIPTSVVVDPYKDTPPAAPKNLQGYAGDKLVHLDWDPNEEPDLKDYLVAFRRESIGSYSVFPAVTANSFDHNDAENGVTYFYKVQARDTEGYTSADSNIVSYTPASAPPLAPEYFVAIFAPAEDGVILDWAIPSEPDIVQFRIIRYDITDGVVDPLIDTVIVTLDYPRTKDPYDPDPEAFIYIPPFVDRLVERETIYRYELAAVDEEGQIGAPTLAPDVEIPK